MARISTLGLFALVPLLLSSLTAGYVAADNSQVTILLQFVAWRRNSNLPFRRMTSSPVLKMSSPLVIQMVQMAQVDATRKPCPFPCQEENILTPIQQL